MHDYESLLKELKENPPAPDDLGRQRMERAILAREPGRDEQAEPESRGFGIGVGVGLAVAAAVVLGIMLFRGSGDAARDGEIASATATFESLRDGVSVRQGELGEGEDVQTTEGQMLVAEFGGSTRDSVRVEVRPESRARFERVDGQDMRVRLDEGRVRVEYHPERRGDESLSVRTPNALVHVVGTVFDVVHEDARTMVRVREGIVRVTAEQTGEVWMVRAGDEVVVGEEGGTLAEELDEHAALSPDELTTEELPGEESVEESELAAPETSEGEIAPEFIATNARVRATRVRSAPAIETDATEESLEDVPVPSVDEIEEIPRLESPPTTSDSDERFTRADRLFESGRYAAARHELYGIARSDESRLIRARAWTGIAESFERTYDRRQAAEAYRRAAQLGRGTSHGANALFALGRLRAAEGNREAATAAFEAYLRSPAAGPLSQSSRRSLCRLGHREYCD